MAFASLVQLDARIVRQVFVLSACLGTMPRPTRLANPLVRSASTLMQTAPAVLAFQIVQPVTVPKSALLVGPPTALTSGFPAACPATMPIVSTAT